MSRASWQAQVELLVQVLPVLETEPTLALKGGTAINLFVRDLPRLSVDLDLAYLPLEPREEALSNVSAALSRMVEQINAGFVPGASARLQRGRIDQLQFTVNRRQAQIKVEVSPVLRGSVYDSEWRRVSSPVRDQYGDARVQILSHADLYGGKLCAALDRSHPRDWFDVKGLLDAGELSREVVIAFLAYLISHRRPLSELLAPSRIQLEAVFKNQFEGMTTTPVTVEELEAAQPRLLAALKRKLTSSDNAFLVSFKAGDPDWALCPHDSFSQLPAIQWKLNNIRKMSSRKREQSLAKLKTVLQGYSL